MINPQIQIASLSSANVMPVVPISARSAWLRGLPLAGTVGGVAAAAETLTSGAIFAADTGTSLKVISIPLGCTYMEIGAWGDNAAIGVSPVVEFWRTHGVVAAGNVFTPDNWSLLRNVLGATPVTMSGTIIDSTAVAGATRYSMDEGTYQQFLFDVRGARAAVARITTIGTTGNWSLFHRFI